MMPDFLVYRPPLTEGWHLLVLLVIGVVVVAVVHRIVRRRVADLHRDE
jgi:hypothetical protein